MRILEGEKRGNSVFGVSIRRSCEDYSVCAHSSHSSDMHTTMILPCESCVAEIYPSLHLAAAPVPTIPSYFPKVAWTICLLSAGYLFFVYTRPIYNRWTDRRAYDPISGGKRSVTAGGAADTSSRTAGREAEGFGASVIPGSYEETDTIVGGWRAYGSTDEAPAGSGCLPPSSSSR